MSDNERLDAFFARLQDDPELSAIAVMLGPYRAMVRDPRAIVLVIEAVIDHWKATAPLETPA